jgi:hypothetical protein
MLWLSSGLTVFSPFWVSAQGSVNLSWQPSPDTNVIGYNIYYGTSSRSYTNEISLGNTTSVTISGLVGGITYYFAATSYDSTGDESDFSNEISYNDPTSVILLSSLKPGSFGGLFYERDAVRVQSSGALNLSVTAAGKYSGTLQMSAGKFAFSGQFGMLCQATNHIIRKNTNGLVLNFSLGSSNQVLGSVSDGLWTANLYGERNGFQATNFGLSAGKYTMIIWGTRAAANSLGHGFGTLTLSSTGSLRFGGTLADGTKVSQSAPVSEFGNWPLFVPLYSGQGLLISWIAFTNTPSGDFGGNLNWIKPPSTKSLLYQSGLAVQRPVLGSFYSLSMNPVPAVTNVDLSLAGALSGSSTNQIVSLLFSKANGTFTGQLRDTIGGKPVSFEGAFLQKIKGGYGFVLGTNLSSPVALVPSTP